MKTAEEVAARVAWLGGSEVAAVLGLSRFKTALQVWSEKAGGIPAEDISDRLPVRLGVKLEQTIAEVFEEDYGKKLHRVNEQLIHPKYPFLRGSIDRRVVGEKAIVEIKSTSPWRRGDWAGEDAPLDYQIQTLYYMGLSGASRGYLVCLIGNQELSVKVLERDEKVISEIMEKAADWWQKFVIPKVMPGVTARDSDILNRLFPMGDEEEPLELGDDANKWLDLIEGYDADLKALENQIDQAKNEVRAILKERQAGASDRWKVTNKDVISRRIDSTRLKKEAPELYQTWSAESKARTLRISKIKQK